MKKIIAVAALVLTLAGIAPAPAQAGGAASAALGLASFAVFNQLVFGLFTPRVWATTTVYGGPYYGGYYYGGYYPPVVYAPPPAAYYPPPPYYAQPAAQVAYAAPRPSGAERGRLPAWPIRIAGRRRDERVSVGVDRESRRCALWRTGPAASQPTR